MKITKKRLTQIIKEEMQKILKEGHPHAWDSDPTAPSLEESFGAVPEYELNPVWDEGKLFRAEIKWNLKNWQGEQIVTSVDPFDIEQGKEDSVFEEIKSDIEGELGEEHEEHEEAILSGIETNLESIMSDLSEIAAAR